MTDSSLDQQILSALPGAVGGLIAGALSARLALSQFLSKRWWELRVESYRALFTALNDIAAYADMRLEELTEGSSYTEERHDTLRKRSSTGRDEVRRLAAMGPFLFSLKVATRLTKAQNALDAPTHSLDQHDILLATATAANEAMKDLRPLARKDLGVARAIA